MIMYQLVNTELKHTHFSSIIGTLVDVSPHFSMDGHASIQNFLFDGFTHLF